MFVRGFRYLSLRHAVACHLPRQMEAFGGFTLSVWLRLRIHLWWSIPPSLRDTSLYTKEAFGVGLHFLFGLLYLFEDYVDVERIVL